MVFFIKGTEKLSAAKQLSFHNNKQETLYEWLKLSFYSTLQNWGFLNDA